MGADYKMIKLPFPSKEEGKQEFYPKLVSSGTVGIEEMKAYAQDASSLSSGDMIAALEVLARFATHHLKLGFSVHIEGIGYLTPTLTSRPVASENEIRSESIHFRNVTFRCDKALKHELKAMTAHKAVPPKRPSLDLASRRERLLNYLAQNPYITTPYYASLAQCSKYAARKELDQWVLEGLLLRVGRYAATMYRRNEADKG